MSFNIQDLDKTDNNNQQNWPEGSMKVQDVNDAGRADEGMLARWFADWNGSKDTAGTSTALTITLDTAPTAYYKGLKFLARTHLSVDAGATLSANGLSADTIKLNGGLDLQSGDLPSQTVAEFVHDGGSTWTVTTVAIPNIGTEQGNLVVLNANRVFDAEQQGFIGEIRWYSGSDTPATWYPANGDALSRTTYATLFGVIGTTYGVGDGSTTFNIPDLRGRTAIGTGQVDGTGTVRSLADKVGEETHTLTVDEMPSHDHPQGLGDNNITAPHGTEGTQANRYTTQPAAGTAEWLTADRGGGQAHNNMQPSLAIRPLIKTGYTA